MNIEIKQMKVGGAYYLCEYHSPSYNSVQRIKPQAIVEYLKGRTYKTGRLPDGRKIIVVTIEE